MDLPHQGDIDRTPLSVQKHIFSLDHHIASQQKQLRITLKQNTAEGITVKLMYDPTPVDIHVGAVCAGKTFFFIFQFILIIQMIY